MTQILDQIDLAAGSWPAEADHAHALALFRTGDTDGALALIEELLRRNADATPAIELGAQICDHLDDQPRQARFLAMLLDDGADLRPRRKLGQLLLKNRQASAALDILEPAIVADPAHVPSLTDYLAALKAAGPDADRSSRLIDLLANTLGPRAQVTAIVALAESVARQGTVEMGLAMLDRDWRGELDEKSAAFYKGRILYNNARRPESEAYFERVADWNDSRQLDARLYLARLAATGPDDDLALARYTAVYALARQNAESLSYFVRHYLKYRDFDTVRRYIGRLEEAEPHHRQLPWLKATLAQRTERPQEAIEILRQATVDTPELVENFGYLADLLTSVGDHERAAEVIEAGAVRHADSMALLGRLIVNAERRALPSAEQMAICDRVLSAHPDSELALRRKAVLLLNAGKRPEALQLFLEGTRLHPNNLPMWRNAAQLAGRQNYGGELDRLLDRARAHFTDGSADSAASLAVVLEAGGRTDEAKALAARGLGSARYGAIARQVIVRQSVETGDFAQAWPHLLELQKPAERPIELVRLYAQVAAGMGYVQPSQERGGDLQVIEGRFPDLVFQEAVHRTPVLSPDLCRPTIFQVTSTLAAGGAERQVALTCQALATYHGDLPTTLVAEDLAPLLGRDFFLPRIDQSRIPVRELRDMFNQGVWRELLAEHPELRDNIRALSSLPPTAHRIALPLYVHLVRHRPQVVHLWQDMIAVAGGLAAVLAGVPRIVLGIRSTRPIEIQRARPFFRSAYIAMLQRDGISMVANSLNGAHDYEDWLGLRRGTVQVIPNACDFEAIQANASAEVAAGIRRTLGIPADAPVLGGVMRCSFEKRPDLWTAVAITLARRNPQFHGLLIGDGPMRSELIKLVEGEGLTNRIHFVGRKTPIEPWMQAMDLLFLSSKTEGLPNVLIEGQALGVAVATMRVGGAPEAVSEGKTAVVLNEATPEQLANELGELLESRERRAQFSLAGPTFVRERFSAEAIAAQYVREFERRVQSNN